MQQELFDSAEWNITEAWQCTAEYYNYQYAVEDRLKWTLIYAGNDIYPFKKNLRQIYAFKVQILLQF